MAITDTFRVATTARVRPTLKALTSLQSIDRSGLDDATQARLDLFVAGIVRRWGWIVLTTVISGAGVMLDIASVGGGVILATAAAFGAFNFSLSAIPRATGYRGAYLHASIGLDLAVLATPLVFLGNGPTAILLVLLEPSIEFAAGGLICPSLLEMS